MVLLDIGLPGMNGFEVLRRVRRASLAPGAAEALAEGSAKTAAEAETKLVELKQKRADLLVEYTEKVPEVRAIDEQIAAMEAQARESRAKAVGVVKTNLETHYRESLAREQSLRSAFDKQRSETLTQNEAAVNYRIIQQEIATNKDLLDGLLQRSKENDVIMAGTPNNIHVVDYATVPKSPVGPKRAQSLLLAALVALVFGARVQDARQLSLRAGVFGRQRGIDDVDEVVRNAVTL